MEKTMENNMFLNFLKNHFFLSFSMAERMIEICPDRLWNNKESSFVFWQQLLHTFAGMQFWLREENTDFIEPFKDKNVHPELDGDPENILSKDDIKKCCKDAKEMGEKWFYGRDDNWLKLPSKVYNKITNFDNMEMQIKHLMYHVGHCEAIFRENGIKTGEYLDVL
jgi:hypothetical protein